MEGPQSYLLSSPSPLAPIELSPLPFALPPSSPFPCWAIDVPSDSAIEESQVFQSRAPPSAGVLPFDTTLIFTGPAATFVGQAKAVLLVQATQALVGVEIQPHEAFVVLAVPRGQIPSFAIRPSSPLYRQWVDPFPDDLHRLVYPGVS